MRPDHAAQTLLVRALFAAVRSQPWPRSLAAGERLGDLVHRLGIRRRVAEANLALAFPEAAPQRRAAILARHYRELGRVAVEYARLPELARAAEGEVVTEVRGREHLLALRGRGVILLSGHYGNFELVGSHLARMNPVDFVVKPQSNRGVDALIGRLRAAAGVGSIPLGAGLRRAFEALRAGHWLAMVADQDARAAGVFVPFMGRPASTPTGPAELSLRSGAPIVMGFVTRLDDGRVRLDVDAPLVPAEARTPATVRELTARHTARLEASVRRCPEMWFWLHRRWKTSPPAGAERRT